MNIRSQGLGLLLMASFVCSIHIVQAAQITSGVESAGKSGRHAKVRSFETNPLHGRRAIVSIVAEGTIVKAGDLVCELDASTLRDSLENLRIEIESTAAELRKETLSREAAELAMREEEARVEEVSAMLSDSLKLAKSKLELNKLRGEEVKPASPADSKDLAEAGGEVAALEARIADRKSLSEELGPLREAAETAREEEKNIRDKLGRLKAEANELEGGIALHRMTAKTDGRVVHARWRPNPSSPEGYAILEPGALVVEGQPLFRISPNVGKIPRPAGKTPGRARRGVTAPRGKDAKAMPAPKG